MHEPWRSPVSDLASYFKEMKDPGSLFLVTGASGTGKTRWCLELVDQARQKGCTPKGLISLAVFEAGSKVAIDLQDLESGEQRRLADRRRQPPEGKAAGTATEAWLFSEETLAWANRALEHLQGAELLVIDEVGPLELREGKGFSQALKLIDGRDYTWAFVTIRPSLLRQALERWPWGETIDLERGEAG